jgi:hypothetical protein
MYINNIISHLDGISLLETQFKDEYRNLQDLLLDHSLFMSQDKIEPHPKSSDKVGLSAAVGTASAASIGAAGLGHMAAASAGAAGLGLGISGAAGTAAFLAMFGPLAIGIPAAIAGGTVLSTMLKKRKDFNLASGKDAMKTLKRDGWQDQFDLPVKNLMHVNHIKNRLGLELLVPGINSLAMSLFFNIQSSARRGEIDAAVIILNIAENSKNELTEYLDQIERLLKDLSPLPTQTPFVILCVSEIETDIRSIALTLEIDAIFIKRTGLFYSDVINSRELVNVEFKREVSKDVVKKLTNTAVAFSNYPKGGVIIIGINDDGTTCGIPKDMIGKWEDTLVTAFRDRINPRIYPDFRTQVTDEGKMILVINVPPFNERLPVMASGSVYVRNGATTVPASPEEVVQIVLSLSGASNGDK